MKPWLARFDPGRYMKHVLPITTFGLIKEGSRANKKKVRETDFLALDLELTGLDSQHDQIVSVGWVPIRGMKIQLAEGAHYLVRITTGVGQSAVIHGIHDHQAAEGSRLCDVMKNLSERYAGYVIIGHHVTLDMAFISMAIQRCFGKPADFESIDTMLFERKRMERKGQALRHNSLRLVSCMTRNNLPVPRHHQALSDAFSCAELFLCQMHQSGKRDMTIAELRSVAR